MELTPIDRIRQYGHLCASDEDAKDFFNIADELEKEKDALEKFEGDDPAGLLRLCAKTLEGKWHPDIVQARANWLNRFATHLESLRYKA